MDTVTRTRFIKKMIDAVIEHEQDSIEKKQNALSAGGGTPLAPNGVFTPQAVQNNAGPGQWYFYNAALKSTRLKRFHKKVGRKS